MNYYYSSPCESRSTLWLFCYCILPLPCFSSREPSSRRRFFVDSHQFNSQNEEKHHLQPSYTLFPFSDTLQRESKAPDYVLIHLCPYLQIWILLRCIPHGRRDHHAYHYRGESNNSQRHFDGRERRSNWSVWTSWCKPSGGIHCFNVPAHQQNQSTRSEFSLQQNHPRRGSLCLRQKL